MKRSFNNGRRLGFQEARRYPQPAPAPRRFVSPRARETHMVADFNSLDDLIKHARDVDGATHVFKHENPEHTRLYFPRNDGEYESAKVWYQNGYWHAQAPSDRSVIGKLPRFVEPISTQHARVAEAKRTRSRSAHHRPRRK